MNQRIKVLISLAAIVVVLLSNGTGTAQTDTEKTYDKDGLKFSYPADWTLTDRSNQETQSLMLSKTGSLVLISITSPRQVISNYEQFRNVQNQINDRYIIAIKQGLNSTGSYTGEELFCLDLNGRNVIGNRYTGLYNGQPSVGDVYPFMLGDRFINLVYMRGEKDAAKTDPAWKKLIGSIYLQDSNKNAAISGFKAEAIASGELSSRVKELAEMNYYSPATYYGYTETTLVRVVVDEKGKAIVAESDAANLDMRAKAEQAAKLSKFRPATACGKPVKYTGVIRFSTKPTRPKNQTRPRIDTRQ